MGRNVRRPQKKRLADLSISPGPGEAYELPPPEECEESVWPVVLDDESVHQLSVRFLIHEGRLVDFAIVHLVRMGGAWAQVAKIDCDGGIIHRHQYVRDGTDIWGHRLIKVIPAGGVNVVEEGYDEALSTMENEWQENYRRWSGGNGAS